MHVLSPSLLHSQRSESTEGKKNNLLIRRCLILGTYPLILGCSISLISLNCNAFIRWAGWRCCWF
ncbi:hypothetical protein BDZ94DRAFT_1263814 [Collybia nuda]|uniref:Uncharacterized protein n=1 Tax=Collybia nuda TaxID=64659 RepID=A0A9P5Y0T4_9AGAR|nr:hypothetical protein BDZ94DRAFT_1263814 [Collybia nuda]